MAQRNVTGIIVENFGSETGRNMVYQPILRMKVTSTGTGNLDVTNAIFNLKGTTQMGDISKLRLCYTPNNDWWSHSFLSYAAVPVSTSEGIEFNFYQSYNSNDGYFVLLADVSSNAGIGNIMDGEGVSVSIGGVNYRPTVMNPAGFTMIMAPMTGNRTIDPNLAVGNGNFTTITSALDSLNKRGCGDGSITFTIADDATFNHQTVGTSTIRVSAKSGQSITLKRSNTGSLRPIINTGTYGNANVLFLQRADNIVIDGLDLRGSNADNGVRLLNSIDDGCKNNTIKNCTITLNKANNNARGISVEWAGRMESGACHTNNLFYNNIISNVKKGYYLADASPKPGQFYDSGNQIGIIDGGISSVSDFTEQGVYARDQHNFKVFSTEFYNGTGNTSGTLAAIDVSNANGTTWIYNNKIHGLSNTNTGNATRTVGISLSTIPEVYVYNNMIWDLKAAATTVNDSRSYIVMGINLNEPLTGYLYHNTVVINNYAYTNTTTGHGCIYLNYGNGSPYKVELKNNLLVNLTTAGVGYIVGQSWWQGQNFASTGDNNLLYCANATASGGIMRADNTNYATLQNYKNQVQNCDQHAVTETSTPFVDVATDLHINTAMATLVSNTGMPCSFVTTDIDGNPRDPNTPDIGADEGTFTNAVADLQGPVIGYSGLLDQNTLTAPAFQATISDASGVNSTTGTLPRLYYRKNGGTWQNVEATNTSSPFNFQFDYTKVGGVAGGDYIEYYVIAQDLAASPNVKSNPGRGLVATSVAAITTHPTAGILKYYIINNAAPLHDDYLIGVGDGEPYATLQAAFTAINNNGISGPVRLLLNDATYVATGQAELREVAGSSSTNTITIKPAPGVQPNYSYNNSSSSYIIRLFAADNVIVDGSNVLNGTSQDLTLETTNAGNCGSINLVNNGNNGCTNVLIKNCKIKGVATPTGEVYAINAAQNSDNFTIQNNNISGGRYGINIQTSIPTVCDNVQINSNIIENMKRNAIAINRGNNISISDNIIRNLGDAAEINAINLNANVAVGTEFSNVSVIGNTISNIKIPASSANNNARGIGINALGTVNCIISNNMISDVLAWNSTGIYTKGGQQIYVYNNTVNLFGDATTYNNASNDGFHACFKTEGNNELYIKNNIFVNTIKTSEPNTGKNFRSFGLYFGNWWYPASNYVDKNIYYVDNSVTTVKGFIAKVNNTNFTTLKDWQNYWFFDPNSIVENVPFVSASDLHINPATATKVESFGDPIAAVTKDRDNENRNAIKPDVGADEGNFVSDFSLTKSTIILDQSNLSLTNPNTLIKLQLKDNQGNNLNITGATVVFSIVNLGASYALGTIGTTVTDMGNGLYQADLTATQVGWENKIFASVNGQKLLATGSFTVSPDVPVATDPSSISNAGFTANWESVANANGYLLEVSSDPAFGSFISGYASKIINSNSTVTVAVSGLSGGTSYYYKLQSTKGILTSNYSNIKQVLTLCDKPVSQSASSITSTAFVANWQSVFGATSYKIDIAKDNTFSQMVVTDQSAATNNYSASSLDPHTQYFYKVRAINASGVSQNSDIIMVNTLNTTPTAADNSLTVDEDLDLSFSAADFNFSDLDINDQLQNIQITLLPAKGTLKLNGTDVTADQIIQKNDLPNLKYKAALNESGISYTTFKFKVSDGIALSSEQTITIGVTAINDKPIIKSQNTLSTDEEDMLVVNITDLIIEDPDNTTFTFSIADGSNYTWQTNEITPANNFAGILDVPVTVSDGTISSEVFQLQITVNNLNDDPSDIALDNSSIDENNTANFVIGNLSTTDPDALDTHTYTIVDSYMDFASFSIDENKLVMSGASNFELKSSYTVKVKSADLAGSFFEKEFVILISDVNEAPTVASAMQDYVYWIGQQIEIDVPSNTFEDIDADDQLTLSLTLVNGDPIPAGLTFDEVNGSISGSLGDIQDLDLRLTATDEDGLEAYTDFSLSIVLGVNSLNGNKIKVYPNPCSDRLVIESIDFALFETVSVCDLSGKTVSVLKISDNTVDLSNLHSGLYIIKLSKGSDSYSKLIEKL